ncbi:MAG TPA: FeoC-like transcriptional regulator [Bacillales bacterium]
MHASQWNDSNLSVVSKNSYIALEEMNFVWTKRQVKKFVWMWRSGESLNEIARHFKRDPDECGLLLMDLARKGKVKPRKGGLT